MWLENKIFAEDMALIAMSPFIPWEQVRGKTVLVTGATGLIGYTAVSALLHQRISVLALVRDEERAKAKFAAQLAEGLPLSFVVGSVEVPGHIDGPVDYIVHCAAPTGSRYFVEHPVETIVAVVNGTQCMLELARQKDCSGMVFLSSMEVYGQILGKAPLTEDCLGTIDLQLPRSSYPEAKRLAENLCVSYASEYGVPVKSVRLAQTFGPGVDWEDGRVFAYIARCALNGGDVLLNTDGAKENMYLYTADAVTAILTVLLLGTPGGAYNASNEETYSSVKDMARTGLDALGRPDLAVCANAGDQGTECYPSQGRLYMDTSALKRLGWRPKVGLPDMFIRMASCFERQ